jgi:Anti-sigma factor NepR
MEREPNPLEKTFYNRLMQTKIGEALRAQYDKDFLSQPLPDRLVTLLLRLDQQQGTELDERRGQNKPDR